MRTKEDCPYFDEDRIICDDGECYACEHFCEEETNNKEEE